MAGNRIKELFSKYGKVALGVHLTVYAGFFSACYIAIDNHVDVRTPLQKIGLLSKEAYDEKHAEAGQEGEKGWLDRALTGGSSTLALAFLCNKALFPVRTPITLGLTPMVARVLRVRAAKKVPTPPATP
ncbi:hypothetical protein C2E20_5331 [Micractinium conductrix]|uniref:DUF1279 domain-containing protein n=1 Tax=Micractinium conductrix TaxID=554055 RepID=A0A2P6VAY8_9CHLO|nr:hypothetical protein C2E20_5331 [Micractinium conductrix]|eukprot:PSC71235.1 hypothetical protein C2E20_5331 [Micractinium conductrix]